MSYLERGLTQSPHRDTLQLLSAALALTPDEASAFFQAGRRNRAIGRTTEADGSDPSNAAPTAEPFSSTPPPYRLIAPLTPLLLTLTGPAGVGKTRLALQVAAHGKQLGFEPVYVDLVGVRQADRVLPAIAAALGLLDTGGQPLFDAVIEAIGQRPRLLALDNFEHVLSAAPLCTAILGACPQSKALVTSRAKLNIRGEYAFEVPPLPAPNLDALPTLQDIEQFGAVALFVERAQAVKPDFTLATAEQGRLVAMICVRLDGLPLAIELAAAQVKYFSLSELSDRLQGATTLDLLTDGPRDLADHQRAMRTTIAWSYDLLSQEAKRVFRTLGVFAGGATVDDLAVVVDLDVDAVRASLDSLTEANLVRRVLEHGARRYDQLVIVRAFAQDRLRAANELATAQRRLAEAIVTLVELAKPTETDSRTLHLNRLIPEHENIGAVLDWILEDGEILFGMRLSVGLRFFWERRGFAAEGAAWMERLLARAAAPQTAEERAIQGAAWSVALVLNHRLSRFERAAEAAEQALALAREGAAAATLAKALNGLANPLTNLCELDRAEALYSESLAIYRVEGDASGEETVLLNLGELRNRQGRHDEALAYQLESLAISHARGEHEPSRALLLSDIGETYIMMDRSAEAFEVLLESRRLFEELNEPLALALLNLGRAGWRMGRHDEALRLLGQASDSSRRQDDVAMLAQELCVIAGIALEQDTLDLAHRALVEVSALASRVSDRRLQWRLVERVAGYACRQGAFASALRLYAAAIQGRDATYDLVDLAERQLRARDQSTALKALGELAGATSEVLPLQQAIELALRELGVGAPNAQD